jgi:predicted RND superfamily exporter protein
MLFLCPAFETNNHIMWYILGRWILKYRLWILLLVLASTGVMTFFAMKVQLSYEFAKAIPVNHPKYKEYIEFKQQFGEDGNLLIIGFEKQNFFEAAFYNDFAQLQKNIKQVPGVEDVLSISSVLKLNKDALSEKLKAVPVFNDKILSQSELDSARHDLQQLPFYKNLL